MTTIAMNTGFPGNGTTQLPSGSQSYSLTNGIAQVAPVDVPQALAAGWTFSGGAAQAYAASQVRVMAPPATSVLANGATVTFPDGTTAALASGVLHVPAQWFNWMSLQNWTLVSTFAGS
jgi:hypothetical protein